MRTCVLTATSLLLIFSSCETKTGTGALAGAGVGALAGGLIGASLDEQDRKIMEEKSPQTLQKIDKQQQLSIYDIKAMSQNGLKDSVIINQIQSTHSIFHLKTEEIIELKQAGVSQNIIEYMIETGK